MLHSRILAIVFLALISSGLSAQWSIGGEPKSFGLPDIKSSDLPAYTTTIPDFDVLALQDELDQSDNVPPRFGMPYKATLDMASSGEWTEIADGRIWRLSIECPGAQTINLNYSDFYMPHGATFHIYSADETEVIGAFTEVNNKQSGLFATGFVKSDKIVLEYFEPSSVKGEGRISVSDIIYGYRSISYIKGELKGYEDSGSCQINVNCPQGDDWQDIKKSVAMIMTAGNFRFCTGALINNTAGNCQAYFLTAEHCMMNQSDAQIQNSIIVFNYETPGCTNPEDEPDLSQNVQGCQILSTGAISDFTLWELEEHPALAPNIPGGVYFAGWDRNNSPSDFSLSIHHPEGDVKKISIDNQSPQSSQWTGNPSGTHWRVRWNDGVTASGSSGSPLFNESGQIIGQLTGGASTCVNPLAQDFYGKMSWNWDSNEDEHDSGLRQFLDAFDEDIFVHDGLLCGAYAFDGSLEIIEPSEISCETVSPIVRVRNNGSETFNLVGVQLKVDGEIVQNKVVTDELTSFSTYDIEFDSFPAPLGGDHVMLVCFININGASDEDASNDCTSVLFGCNASGIEELSNISIYPNPTQGQLQLSGIEEPTRISLYTTDGKLVIETTVNNSQTLDLSKYQAGLYMLRLQQGEAVVMKKVGLVD